MSGDRRAGLARVWLGPEPERGAHSSIVGIVSVTSLGVNVPPDAMANLVNLAEYDANDHWPMGCWCEWSESGVPSLIPWHRVHCIDWHDDDGQTVETLTNREWES